MALKSSQPRRNASLKSERPILRTTNAVETPNNCSLGLAKYCVAMAAVSLARGRRGENGALKSRVSAPCAKIAVEPSTANQLQRKKLRGTNPAATFAARVARYAIEGNSHPRLGELCICTSFVALRYQTTSIGLRSPAPRSGDKTRRRGTAHT